MQPIQSGGKEAATARIFTDPPSPSDPCHMNARTYSAKQNRGSLRLRLAPRHTYFELCAEMLDAEPGSRPLAVTDASIPALSAPAAAFLPSTVIDVLPVIA